MSFSLINFAVAKSVLDRDRPNADPQAVLTFSMIASILPGNIGLLLPFMVERGALAQTNGTSSGTKTTTASSPVSSPSDCTDANGAMQEQINTVNQKLDEIEKQDAEMSRKMDDLLSRMGTLQATSSSGTPTAGK